MTFAQCAIAYRDAGKPTRFLERIEDHWRDTPVRQITIGAIRQSAKRLYPKAKGATLNRQVITPTVAIINHAAELEWCSPIKVKRFKVEAKTKVPVTREWVEAFAAHASDHLGALALFMYGTGARITEATSLLWRDVDLVERTAIIRQSKIEDTRTAHLPPPVCAAMANIPSNRQPEAPVFGYAGRGSVKDPWAATIKRAGIKVLTPHSCRHGFATDMLRAGVDPKTVARAGGWKDVTTVMRTYAHAIEDRSVTDALFDTNLAQRSGVPGVSSSKERKKTG
ncbi:MAG: tyrosine-type recombinase/integrase [Devosia sp.]